MEQPKTNGCEQETVETNKAAEIKLDNLSKKLSEEEAKNVTGGVSIHLSINHVLHINQGAGDSPALLSRIRTKIKGVP